MSRHAPTPARATAAMPANTQRVLERASNLTSNSLIMFTACYTMLMPSSILGQRCALALCMLGAAAAASYASDAVTSSNALAVKLTADVQVRGRGGGALASADRVVPGDEVFYTLEIRNTGAVALPAPWVDYPIPDHMRYVADSAAGPGAEVSYSIDGGRTFDRAENLKVKRPSGSARAATVDDYTHIRWRLKHALRGNAVALARFRAVVK